MHSIYCSLMSPACKRKQWAVWNDPMMFVFLNDNTRYFMFFRLAIEDTDTIWTVHGVLHDNLIWVASPPQFCQFRRKQTVTPLLATMWSLKQSILVMASWKMKEIQLYVPVILCCCSSTLMIGNGCCSYVTILRIEVQ